MNLSFIEFLITRLTSWPVVTLFIVLLFRNLVDVSTKMLVMTKLKDGVEGVIDGYDAVRARRQSEA